MRVGRVASVVVCAAAALLLVAVQADPAPFDKPAGLDAGRDAAQVPDATELADDWAVGFDASPDAPRTAEPACELVEIHSSRATASIDPLLADIADRLRKVPFSMWTEFRVVRLGVDSLVMVDGTRVVVTWRSSNRMSLLATKAGEVLVSVSSRLAPYVSQLVGGLDSKPVHLWIQCRR